MMPKLQKSTDRDPELITELITSEGGQDTSACKISGHFLLVHEPVGLVGTILGE